MKYLTPLLILLIASVATAREGLYIGAQAGSAVLEGGPSKANLSNTYNASKVIRERVRFEGGAYMGYNFDITGKPIDIGPQLGSRYISQNRFIAQKAGVEAFKGTHHLRIIDLVAAATWHMTPTWDVQGKAGGAFVLDKVTVVNNEFLSITSGRKTALRPEVGVGLGYTMYRNVRISLDAAHIFGTKVRVQETNNPIADFNKFKKVPHVTAVTMSLQYLF